MSNYTLNINTTPIQKMSEKETAIEIYERMSNILCKHIFNGYHDIAIELSINEVNQIIKSHKDWSTEQEEYLDFYTKVILELCLLS